MVKIITVVLEGGLSRKICLLRCRRISGDAFGSDEGARAVTELL